MKIKDIIAPLEAFAPLSWQEGYDNSGLIVGHPDTDVAGALICVDPTKEVMDEAEKLGARLIISHHPVIFHPVKRFNSAGHTELMVERAIRTSTALYACHTNLDRAPRGMSWFLADRLGLEEITVIDPDDRGAGFGVIGRLAHPVPSLDFLRSVAATLGVGCVRHSPPPASVVQKIALVTGAGGDGLERAIAAGADVFLTADLRYDRFLSAAGRILLADVGHFESEFCAIDLIYDIISKKIPTFALYKSADALNPVCYLT
jgi:dinuclear metal center YbgI/SA1388 family protein